MYTFLIVIALIISVLLIPNLGSSILMQVSFTLILPIRLLLTTKPTLSKLFMRILMVMRFLKEQVLI